MSEEEKITQKIILKRQIATIPIRLLVTYVIMFCFNKPLTVDNISSFFSVAFCFIVMYSAITLIAWFSKAVGNWLIGIILFFVCLIGIGMANMPKALDLILGLTVSFCGVIVDVSRIVKLIRLSAKPKEAPAEQQSVPVVVVNTVQEKD